MVLQPAEGDFGIPGDGTIADVPAKAPREPEYGVCGCVEQFGDGTPALKLATNRPLVFVQDALPGFDQDAIWSWFNEAYNKRWASVCDWQAKRIRDMSEAGATDYVNLITVADLGGSGVLADQMLPYSGGRVLRMRLNNRIQWRPHDDAGQGIDPVRVIVHEGGHFMGHAHWPVGQPTEIMEPTYNRNIITPQQTEGRVSASWFGLPVAEPGPTPPQPPSGGTIILPVSGSYRFGAMTDGKTTLIFNP